MTLGFPYPQFSAPELVRALQDRHKSLAGKIDAIRAQQAADYLRFELMIERGHNGQVASMKLLAERLERLEQSSVDVSRALLDDAQASNRLMADHFTLQQVVFRECFDNMADHFASYFFRSIWLAIKRAFTRGRN